MKKEEILSNGTKVIVNENHRIGTDSLLLLDFVNINQSCSVADFCAGCGILIWGLIDKGVKGDCFAIEINEEATNLIIEANLINDADKLKILNMDINLFRTEKLLDLVISNPPYFSQGIVSPNPQRAIARHDKSCSLNTLCVSAKRVLKDKGKFCLCYPANRLVELFLCLQQNMLEPKRLCFVRNNEKKEPWLVLLEARKNGGKGLSVLPDIILPPGKNLIF